MNRNSATIAGIDEVGKGSLFGPVFAGAVVLSKSAEVFLKKNGLTDSKKLSSLKRSRLVPLIKDAASSWALGQASSQEIDQQGIRMATENAMIRALQKLTQEIDLILIDGLLPIRQWKGDQQTIVRGDSKYASIAAASVLAKVARDDLIKRLSIRFQGYGLEQNMGYGTAIHRKNLLALGASPLHRQSFLKKIFSSKKYS